LAACPAYAKNPRMQGGGYTDIAFCQVIFAHFVNIFTLRIATLFLP